MNRDLWITAMQNYYGTDQRRIQHTMQVLNFSEKIMDREQVGEWTRAVTTAAAILHDIGIPEAERKYNSSAAPFQEMEGIPISRHILTGLGENDALIARVVYIVGNHHTKEKIDGLDFQIVWEADMLVNLRSVPNPGPKDLEELIASNFSTLTGLKIAREIYLS